MTGTAIGGRSGPGTPMVGALEQASEAVGHAAREANDAMATVDAGRSIVGVSARPPRQEQGEGIGLSIVKRLAELLDATVEVKSDATGTTFRVLLPRSYAH